MRDLGMFAAVSVFSSAVFALIILPHFLPNKKGNKIPVKSTLLDKFARYSFHKNKWLKFKNPFRVTTT